MGYIRHHAIIVVTFKKDLAEQAHAIAQRWFGSLATPLVQTPVNGFWTFSVLPDGSKEGWADSDNYDVGRASLIAWITDQAYQDGSNPFDWIEVSFDEEGHAEVISVNP